MDKIEKILCCITLLIYTSVVLSIIPIDEECNTVTKTYECEMIDGCVEVYNVNVHEDAIPVLKVVKSKDKYYVEFIYERESIFGIKSVGVVDTLINNVVNFKEIK